MACARGYNGLISEPLPQSNPDTPDSKHHYAKYKFSMKYEEDFTDCYIDPRFFHIELIVFVPIAKIVYLQITTVRKTATRSRRHCTSSA